MKRLKELALVFAWVTTGVLMASTLFIGIFYGFSEVTANVLWQDLVCAFVCTLGSLIYPAREISKRETVVFTILHYLYINIVVIGCGLIFEWFDIKSLGMVIAMVVLVAVVFIVVCSIWSYRAKKLADEMNRRLETYHSRKMDER